MVNFLYVLLTCALSEDVIFPRIPIRKGRKGHMKTSASFQRMIQRYTDVESMHGEKIGDKEVNVIVGFRSEASAENAVNNWNKLKTYDDQKAEIL